MVDIDFLKDFYASAFEKHGITAIVNNIESPLLEDVENAIQNGLVECRERIFAYDPSMERGKLKEEEIMKFIKGRRRGKDVQFVSVVVKMASTGTDIHVYLSLYFDLE